MFVRRFADCFKHHYIVIQDKGSTGANDEVDSTESASTGGSSETAAPLVLLQEFSLATLMVRSSHSLNTCKFNPGRSSHHFIVL